MKIDFLDELVALLGSTGVTPEQYMIEHSLFFDKDVVDKAFDEMLNNINTNKPVPVRKSTKQGVVYQNGQQKLWKSIYQDVPDLVVTIDSDGNREVRALINRLTGITISQGANSSIMFGKISHIWGEAINPLFFTALWNIVIVPAYINDVLDKNDDTHSFVSRIKEIYKAICWTKYDVENKLTRIGFTKQEIDKYAPNIFVLNGITYKLQTIPMNTARRRGGPRRQYTINGTGNYSMYDVMGKFAIYRMGKGETIDDVNKFAEGYTNSSICFFSDDKTKVYRWQLQKDNGTYCDHFYKFSYMGVDYFSTKELGGDEKGKFAKLMKGINEDNPDFQIVEI